LPGQSSAGKIVRQKDQQSEILPVLDFGRPGPENRPQWMLIESNSSPPERYKAISHQ
jgi:hypothetical protein